MAIALSDNSESNKPDASTSNSNTTTGLSSDQNNKINNSNTPTRSTCEMMGACTVCSDDQGTEENPLVYCDGCEVGVHQACYGIVSVPAGNWFCRRCEVGDSQGKIKCELCPSLGGALKQTKDGKWAHVVCALYIPEVRFGNNNTMEPIETEHIHAERFNKTCYLCEERGNSTKSTYGAVMNCHKLGCKQSFHVTCAQTANLLCEETRPSSPDNVNYCGYCKHHFRKLKAGNRKSNNSGVNNSGSSYLDSASDSSQDNDSRYNERTGQDKNTNRNNNKLPVPTNESLDTISSKVSAPTPVATTSSSLLEAPQVASRDLFGAPSKSANTNSVNKPSTNLTSPSAAPRKKKTAKDQEPGSSGSVVSASQSNNVSTLLATTSSNISTNETYKTQSSIRVDSTGDPYDWSESKDSNNKNSSGNNNKPAKKKTTDSGSTSLQVKSSKQPQTTTSNSVNINLQKVSSPNLSVSTSPSMASPSNSTRSTSNSSTSSLTTATATSSSSSSSTVSNSPSPALLSPNVSNRTPTSRLESPLASSSKTGISTANRLTTDSTVAHLNPPVSQGSIQTKINLDDPKSDLKKVGSSLLSTVPSISQDHATNNPTATVGLSDAAKCQKLPSYLPDASLTNAVNNKEASATHGSNLNITTTNAQPSIPPLIIPTSQAMSSSASANIKTPTAKASRASAKTTRKKSTEVSDSTQKSEPKAKPSRSRKTASSTIDSSATEAIRPESKRATKNKSAAKSAESSQPTSSGSADNSISKSQVSPATSPSKRKSRSASNESTSQGSAPKKPRRKKADTKTNDSTLSTVSKTGQNASKTPLPPVTFMSTAINSAAPLTINTPLSNRFATPITGPYDCHDVNSRFISPMISPYTNLDPSSAPSLSRSSLSRLFTSSSMTDCGIGGFQSSMADDVGKAFEELRDNTWSHLSKSILEQAQQFDIPSLIGTLYTLRSENEKLINRVRDLTMKRDQLVAMNARLDLPGPMLPQHLSQTSPNFSSIAAGLGNSPKASPSPGSAMGKPSLVGPYNHVPHGTLGAATYLDRSSPLVNQGHHGINSIKPSTMSTPSPPISALMAHTAGRSGLTVNQPYMSNVFPPTNTLATLGPNAPGSSYYPRQ